jgi:hypothetical protein
MSEKWDKEQIIFIKKIIKNCMYLKQKLLEEEEK